MRELKERTDEDESDDEQPAIGYDHVTVVPTNYDPDDE